MARSAATPHTRLSRQGTRAPPLDLWRPSSTNPLLTLSPPLAPPLSLRYRAPECLLTDGYYNYKMDMWGVGCVFFEIVSLFPLFPGTNELDQIQKIHNIIGTPPPELLAKMKQRSQHMDFNFPPKEGTGIAKLIPHASPECIELVSKLLEYNPDDRLSARQALRHPYFRQLREQDKRQQQLMSPELNMSNGAGGAQESGGVSQGQRTGREDHNSSLPSITGGAKGGGGAGYHGGGAYQQAGHPQADDDHYGEAKRRTNKGGGGHPGGGQGCAFATRPPAIRPCPLRAPFLCAAMWVPVCLFLPPPFPL